MEKRKANIIFNKNGNGFITTKVTLPVPWIRSMNITEDNKEVEIIYENDSIILKKLTPEEDKSIILEKAENILNQLQNKSVSGNIRKTLKNKLNEILSEALNKGLDIEYFTIKYDFIKEINVYKTNLGNKQAVVVFEHNYKFKEN